MILVTPAAPPLATMSYTNFTEELVVMCKKSLSKGRGLSFSESMDSKYSDRNADNGGLWITEPTTHRIIVYSIAIPIVSALGIIANALILAVLSKKDLKSSVFTYLTVLTGADLVTCVLLLFSGLARGIFHCNSGWLQFDTFVHLPLGSVSSNITVWAAVCISVDRLAIVCSFPCREPPKFCDQQVARKMMVFSGCFATLINLPYCFIYTYNEQGELITTKFFHSRWYNLQNWLQFVIFGLIPGVFLLVANVIMCQSVRKAMRRRQLLLCQKNIREGNRLRDQERMTVMLVGIVFVFLAGELPTHLASRRSAVSILYGGDATRVRENVMEKFRMYATLLNALASSANFVLYCLLSRQFLSHLKNLFSRKSIVENDEEINRATCRNKQDKNEVF